MTEKNRDSEIVPTDGVRVDLPGLSRGVELNELQIWRDAESQNVIIQVPARLIGNQLVFTPGQWKKAVKFLEAH